ncbi:hypothetical protein OSCT_1777 [Oscillochloris trichoides DG-6]|uniref:Uncharacterized protein n=1 Tax=Oscillochloris trichoides DG-6 TaxID=765420 RepID=E1IEM6_9CHLR|nr:hypothetical protein [Oscillochloris trichoides]EFO80360.1 hypothetical protein OSCT_1777 [Oscillochloris trichoides DG-6]
MPLERPDERKLLFGALLVGASALPAGAVVSGLLAGVGGNWLAEAVGGVIGAGPPPGVALTRAFARAVQTAASDLRKAYGLERVRHEGEDGFDLLRQSAREITLVEAPAGVADMPAVQQHVGAALAQVLHGFPDAQVRLLREQLLPATARAFQEELAREPEAWRLYHGWVLERLATQSAAIQAALAAQPQARAALGDAALLEDRLDDFGARLDALLEEVRAQLRAAAGGDLDIDQSELSEGISYGALNRFGGSPAPTIPAGKLRINQSRQRGGISWGALNSFPTPPPAQDEDE